MWDQWLDSTGTVHRLSHSSLKLTQGAHGDLVSEPSSSILKGCWAENPLPFTSTHLLWPHDGQNVFPCPQRKELPSKFWRQEFLLFSSLLIPTLAWPTSIVFPNPRLERFGVCVPFFLRMPCISMWTSPSSFDTSSHTKWWGSLH